MTHDDNLLLALLRRRDDAARRQLHDRHHERLRRYFRARFAEPDDLVNEVFTRAWESLEAGATPTESIDQWLWGIARNVLRERARTQDRTIGADPSFFDDRPGDDPHESFDNDGKAKAIQDAWEIIERLTGPRRVVLTAHLRAIGRDGHELKGAELARELGPPWSREKVDRQLSRAKADVRQQMGALAVARAAVGCAQAAELVGRRPDPGLTVADLSGSALAALVKHAVAPATEPVCKRCGMVFRDAQRPGLYALGPGAALLAARLTPDDDDERHRTFAMLLGRDRPDGGLLQRGRDLTAVGLARAGRLPGVGSAIQAVQDNPMVARAAAVAVSLVTALLLTSGGSPPSSPPTPATEAIPSAAAPVEESHPVPTAEPTTSPAAAPVASPAGEEPVSSEPALTTTGPPAGEGTTTTIDATALSHERLAIPGVGWWHPRDVKTLDLPPGRHAITSAFATPIFVVVDDTGVVDYDPALGFLSGRGTRTLTIHGLPVTLDGSALLYTHITLSQATPWLPNTGPHDLRLLPGRYTFYGAFSTGLVFTLDATGRIDYNPAHTYVTGRGTNRLTVAGLPVTLDGSQLSYLHIGISGLRWLPNTGPRAVRLMPGRYTFVCTLSTGVVFTVGESGTIDYGAGEPDHVTGRGSATLAVSGLPLTVDATQTLQRSFWISPATGALDAHRVQPMRMLPGRFAFQLSDGRRFAVSVTPEGTFDYEPSEPGVSGLHTATLTVG